MLMQLLQGGFNPPPGAPNPANNAAFAGGALAGGLAAVLCVAVVMVIALYGPYIFMLVKAMQALQAVRPRNRSMAPGLVWLALIPCVPIVMNFIIVMKTSEALDNEFEDRRLKSRGDHGKQLGLIYAVIVLVTLALNGVSNVLSRVAGQGGAAGNDALLGVVMALGCLSLFLIIAQIVLPIMFGLKLSQSTARLHRSEGRYRDDDDDRGDDDDFEEYDEPKPKPKPKKKPKLDDDFEEYDEPKGGR